ncbi:MAG TPA: hypothetical protein VG433_15495, partial [Pirellulales bacterium]|nr:hypothetical protein [Pirellulales bacterium]
MTIRRPATRNHHPATRKQLRPKAGRPKARRRTPRGLEIPLGERNATLEIDGRQVVLTNLDKLFWP